MDIIIAGLQVTLRHVDQFSSVQFSSVQFSLFSQNKLQYKDTYKSCKLARDPRRNRRIMKPGLPNHNEISKVKIRGE